MDDSVTVGMDFVSNVSDSISSITRLENAVFALSGRFKTFGIIAGAVFAAKQIAQGFEGIMKAGQQTEDQIARLETIMASVKGVTNAAKAARDEYANAVKFAAVTPFDVPGVVNAAIQLRGLGIDALKVQKDLKGTATEMKEGVNPLRVLGNAAAATGNSVDELVGSFGMAAQGRNLDDFLYRMRALGKMGEIRKQLAGITVGTEKYKLTLLKAVSGIKEFQGAMEKQSKTLTGILSNVNDSMDGFVRNLAGFELDFSFYTEIKAMFFDLANWFTDYADSIKIIANLISFFLGTSLKLIRIVVQPIVDFIKIFMIKVLDFLGIVHDGAKVAEDSFKMFYMRAQLYITGFLIYFQMIFDNVWNAMKGLANFLGINLKGVLATIGVILLQMIIPAIIAFGQKLFWSAIMGINLANVMKLLSKVGMLVVLSLLMEMIFAWDELSSIQKAAYPVIVALISAFMLWSNWATIMAAKTTIATTVTTMFNAALYANPIGLIVIGIVALIAALVLMIVYFEDIYNWIQKTWTEGNIFIKVLMGIGAMIFFPITQLFLLAGAIKWVYNHWAEIVEALDTGAAMIGAVAEAIYDSFVEYVVGVIEDVSMWIDTILAKFPIIGQVASAIGEVVMGVLEPWIWLFTQIYDLVMMVVNAISSIKIPDGIKDFFFGKKTETKAGVAVAPASPSTKAEAATVTPGTIVPGNAGIPAITPSLGKEAENAQMNKVLQGIEKNTTPVKKPMPNIEFKSVIIRVGSEAEAQTEESRARTANEGFFKQVLEGYQNRG